MADDVLPTQSDTPDDHTVIGLELHADTLPEWFERIKALAPEWARRMSVLEHPDFWYLKIEIHDDKVEDFHVVLAEAWKAYQADVAAGLAGPEGETIRGE